MPGEPSFARLAAEAHAHGKSCWPAVELDFDLFCRHLLELDVRPDDLSKRGRDLFISCAVLRGDAEALRVLEREFMSRVERQIERAGFDADFVVEARQEALIRMLMGPQPRIGRYSGRGALASWLGISAVRVAYDLARVREVEPVEPYSHLLAEMIHDPSTPDRAVVKNLTREQVQAALDEAFEGLEVRQLTILRLHYFDGLTLDGLAALYRVHRATVARWLLQARARVLRVVKARLGLKIQPSNSELRSLVRSLERELTLCIDATGGP